MSENVQKSGVEMMLDTLSENVSVLQIQLNELKEVLQPVMIPISGESGVSGMAGMSGKPSIIMSKLMANSSAIQTMTFTLNSILKRLTI